MINTYYPAYLDLRGRRCAVFGGGHEEEAKAKTLAENGARVIVITPQVTPPLQALAQQGILSWEARSYENGDLEGVFLAIAETGDTPLKRHLYREAEERNVLLNVIDVTHLCIWIAPAIVKRGNVTVAISTAGASPALARKLRESVTQCQALEWADLAPLLSQARQELKRQGIRVSPERWQAALTNEFLELYQQGKHQETQKRLMASLLQDGHAPAPNARSSTPDNGPIEDEEAIRYYPVFLDLQDRRSVVVGGGDVAEGKVKPLLESNAKVTVISPQVTPDLQWLAQEGGIIWEAHPYREGDLKGAFVAIAATNDPAVNQRIAAEAEERNVLVNVVDNPYGGRFIAPSTIRRGVVTLAISTGGASPSLARRLKEELARCAAVQWADVAPLLSEARQELKRQGVRVTPNHWQTCLTDELLALYHRGHHQAAYDLLMEKLMSEQQPVAQKEAAS